MQYHAVGGSIHPFGHTDLTGQSFGQHIDSTPGQISGKTPLGGFFIKVTCRRYPRRHFGNVYAHFHSISCFTGGKAHGIIIILGIKGVDGNGKAVAHICTGQIPGLDGGGLRFFFQRIEFRQIVFGADCIQIRLNHSGSTEFAHHAGGDSCQTAAHTFAGSAALGHQFSGVIGADLHPIAFAGPVQIAGNQYICREPLIQGAHPVVSYHYAHNGMAGTFDNFHDLRCIRIFFVVAETGIGRQLGNANGVTVHSSVKIFTGDKPIPGGSFFIIGFNFYKAEAIGIYAYSAAKKLADGVNKLLLALIFPFAAAGSEAFKTFLFIFSHNKYFQKYNNCAIL